MKAIRVSQTKFTSDKDLYTLAAEVAVEFDDKDEYTVRSAEVEPGKIKEFSLRAPRFRLTGMSSCTDVNVRLEKDDVGVNVLVTQYYRLARVLPFAIIVLIAELFIVLLAVAAQTFEFSQFLPILFIPVFFASIVALFAYVNCRISVLWTLTRIKTITDKQ